MGALDDFRARFGGGGGKGSSTTGNILQDFESHFNVARLNPKNSQKAGGLNRLTEEQLASFGYKPSDIEDWNDLPERKQKKLEDVLTQISSSNISPYLAPGYKIGSISERDKGNPGQMQDLSTRGGLQAGLRGGAGGVLEGVIRGGSDMFGFGGHTAGEYTPQYLRQHPEVDRSALRESPESNGKAYVDRMNTPYTIKEPLEAGLNVALMRGAPATRFFGAGSTIAGRTAGAALKGGLENTAFGVATDLLNDKGTIEGRTRPFDGSFGSRVEAALTNAPSNFAAGAALGSVIGQKENTSTKDFVNTLASQNTAKDVAKTLKDNDVYMGSKLAKQISLVKDPVEVKALLLDAADKADAKAVPRIVEGSGVPKIKTDVVPTAEVGIAPKPSQEVTHVVPGESSLTLNSGVNPGVMEFAKQDVIPKAASAVASGKNLTKEIKSIVAPASVDENAKQTALVVRKFKSTAANNEAEQAAAGKKAFKVFNKTSDAENLANLKNYELGNGFAKEPVKGYSQVFKDSTDFAHNLDAGTYGKNDLGFIENYVRHNLQFSSDKEATNAAQTLYKTLQPSKGHLRERTLNMPLEDVLNILKERGIKVKAATTNPELIRQGIVNNAVQARAFKDMGTELKQMGLVKFVRPGDKIPEGMVKLEDRAFSKYFPSEAGLVKAGEFYAPESAARIMNNSVAPGLEQYSWFRGLRNIKNNMNLLQLGISAFHGGTTTINSSLNDLAIGIGDLGRGKVRGVGEVGRGLVPGASVVRQTYLGSKAFKAFAGDNPEAAKILRESLNPSGFRLRMENRYKTTATENMMNAFHNGNIIGGALRAPFAAIEQTTRPIMEHLVPNAKLGAMMDRAASIQARNPNASPKELAELLSKASDSVDNIYGQLVYDNLFWNKTFKDLAMLSQRSVGWNLGTLREVGGGITDVGTKTILGRGGREVTDRTLYAASLPLLVGTYGAVYQYLHTGKGPESLLDYFYPKTGEKDKNGNDQRVSFPSYMKDVVAYAKNPIETIQHKTSPMFSMAAELLTNKNYYGDLIRNPDDPISKQLQQVGEYALTTLSPFSVTQARQRQAEGASLAGQLEAGLGITNAPGSVTKSSLEQAVISELNKTPKKPRTPEEVQADNNKVKDGTSLERSLNYLLKTNKGAAADIISKASPNDLQVLSPQYLESIRKNAAYGNTLKQTKDDTKQANSKLLQVLGGDYNSLAQQKKSELKAKRKK